MPSFDSTLHLFKATQLFSHFSRIGFSLTVCTDCNVLTRLHLILYLILPTIPCDKGATPGASRAASTLVTFNIDAMRHNFHQHQQRNVNSTNMGMLGNMYMHVHTHVYIYTLYIYHYILHKNCKTSYIWLTLDL